ncbi:PREDICTED: uncharacterized protein LOC104818741 [Tarenaya hassleriana]|uniref:uncharacterized protein LOC104818741 n=1 Tax=Tarenaya hassleriana TaxID=28532 RepID=UPI00053C92D1|nr:PREDICTED: uncharacterized protein LOC104818741 [Tarenaya hassleriana]
MEGNRSPPTRSYKSYEGDRNLELVDPKALKPVRGIYVVRESIKSRSQPSNSNTWQKISYKQPSSLSSIKQKRSSHSTSIKGWWNDPEAKRKRRVAKYKFYSAEGKVKTTLKRGYRWIKNQCSKIIHSI